jgi:hypothetical protein
MFPKLFIFLVIKRVINYLRSSQTGTLSLRTKFWSTIPRTRGTDTPNLNDASGTISPTKNVVNMKLNI